MRGDNEAGKILVELSRPEAWTVLRALAGHDEDDRGEKKRAEYLAERILLALGEPAPCE